MGLALRDVNESLAGSLGIAEGTSEYMNMTSSVSDTVENFIGDGSAINIKLTEELFKLTSEVKNTIKTLLKKPTDVEEISGLSPVMKATLGEEEKRTLAGAKKIIADMMTADEEMESFTASVMRTPEKADRSDIMLADATAETERLIKETTVAIESVIREETIRMMTKDWTGLIDMNKPSDGDHAKVKATLKKSTEEYAEYVAELNRIYVNCAKMRQIRGEHDELQQCRMQSMATYLEETVVLKTRAGKAGISEEETEALKAKITEIDTLKDGLKSEMERTKADIEMQTEVIESYSTAVTAIVQKYMPAGTVNLKEKPLAELDLKKYAGELTAASLEKADQPQTVTLLRQMINGIISTYPTQLGALAPAMNMIFKESQLGKHKTVPMSLSDENQMPGSMATKYSISQDFMDQYKGQSGALYSILARKFEKAMLITKRPYTVGGTVSSALNGTIMACDGDIVMALFILIDKMEKYGWKDRNSKSEYYNHCDVMIASEPSLLKVIKLLQRPMMESLRIGVTMDYAVLNQVAIAFMRREQGVLSGICRKYQDRDDIKDGNKCLQALDDLIAEVSAKLEEYNIDVTPTVSVGVHQAEAMACFTGHANVVIGPEWNQDSRAVVHATGTKKKYTPLNRDDIAKYTPAPKYSKLKCGNVNCDTLLSGAVLKRTAHFMEIMDFEPDAGCKTICNDCFVKLKEKTLPSIETKVGTLMMGTNRFGREAPILKKGDGKAAANQVKTANTESNNLAGKKREELQEMRDNLDAMLKDHPDTME